MKLAGNKWEYTFMTTTANIYIIRAKATTTHKNIEFKVEPLHLPQTVIAVN